MTNILTSVNEWIKFGINWMKQKNVCLLSEFKNNKKKIKESNVTFCFCNVTVLKWNQKKINCRIEIGNQEHCYCQQEENELNLNKEKWMWCFV